MNNRSLGGARMYRQAGFTPGETGVVLVIIGLLLGVLLKGQELIGSVSGGQ